jgi:outer membrane biogenesis lipoprotein LolB
MSILVSSQEADMRIRHVILALLVTHLLIACSGNPNISPGNSSTWDQSNFESANWN